MEINTCTCKFLKWFFSQRSKREASRDRCIAQGHLETVHVLVRFKLATFWLWVWYPDHYPTDPPRTSDYMYTLGNQVLLNATDLWMPGFCEVCTKRSTAGIMSNKRSHHLVASGGRWPICTATCSKMSQCIIDYCTLPCFYVYMDSVHIVSVVAL
jgi:hypothetical protein